MDNLRQLWQLANTASVLAEVARKAHTYSFITTTPITFYMQAEAVQVRIRRWDQPRVEVGVQLRVPMAWRVVTEQDDAGVYCVARRRPVVGGWAGAKFTVSVPTDTYLMLKLTECDLAIDGYSGTMELPPIHDQRIVLPPSNAPLLKS